jgi:sugar lactone lactonase YvrE
MRVISDIGCKLGEGPLWSDGWLWWFDIDGLRLHRCGPGGEDPRVWELDEPHSAAGRIAGGGMLVASASGLWRFDPETGARDLITPLEADIPGNRSNDGRADRRGGFWIGTMSMTFETGAGSIYRYADGRLEKLFGDITVSNAICFSPNGGTAYFTDTRTGKIMRWALDAAGWPMGAPEVFIDHTAGPGYPDGAAVDSEGFLWNAQWDGWRLARYSPEGALDRVVALPVARPTCPAFGGPGLRTLFCTSASVGLNAEARAAQPHAGGVFAIDLDVAGLPDGEVRLS